ncbi:MAG: toll/interleukin-1 receptor domain-containing protein [Tabrizicola sp.]|uniref:toll/interleukin-1 receptor domain-containing protein n=1 Tax=Tabrizicola sp. TaxID=2005166 RepID=UPI003BB0564A
MIRQNTLMEYAARSTVLKSDRALHEAQRLGRQTAFLSHSHKDRGMAKGVQAFLQAQGWDVYIDWEDTEMPAKPNRQTADRIKNKIVQLDWFLYLATQNSAASRWCPWEIGFADGKRSIDRIVILPTSDSYSTYGSEYLDLYRHIEPSTLGDLRVYAPDRTSVLLKDLRR